MVRARKAPGGVAVRPKEFGVIVKLPAFQPATLFAFALMAVIIMMILPVPAVVLDVGLAFSFSIAVLIFSISLFVTRPLDFSTFPTILLTSLMLRLALNVSSTKLIIAHGHEGTQAAGRVIESFASFIMGGSLALGLVIFGILMIVNFVVINKGATRMAEVGARFALDAMPGKQLSIDADLSAGAITHEEASARRSLEQAETTFLGSLDGASKFVKGDAVAGILITALNLIVGITMGVVVNGMAIGDAFETYAILTVGDGLVGQIPAVIISVASALLLSRGGVSGSTDSAMISEFGRFPAALGLVAAIMAIFAVLPGLPFLPFMGMSLLLGTMAYLSTKKDQAVEDEVDDEEEEEHVAEQTLGDVLDLDEIHLEFSPNLVPLVLDSASGLNARIISMRTHIAKEFGVLLPEVRLTDSAALPAGDYTISILGVQMARGSIRETGLLVLTGDDTIELEGEQVSEPVYGAPAVWVGDEGREVAAMRGLTVIQPNEVVATHLLEIIKSNFPKLMTLRSLKRLLDEMGNLSDRSRAEANQRIIEGMIPEKVSMELLLTVLRLLLDEGVSIRNLVSIIECTAEAKQAGASVEQIVEHVRRTLGFQILSRYKRDDGTLPLVQVSPEWEEIFLAHQIAADRGGTDVALPPEEFNRLAEAVTTALDDNGVGSNVPLLVSANRRRFLKTVLVAKGLPNPVVSFEELSPDARPALVGTVAA